MKLSSPDEAAQGRTNYLRPLIQHAYQMRRGPDLRCGVYILFVGRKPVYVGMAKCVARRIAQHIGKIKFDDYSVIECDYYKLQEVEYDVITLLAPTLNQVGGDRENGVLRKVSPLVLRHPRAWATKKKRPDVYQTQGN